MCSNTSLFPTKMWYQALNLAQHPKGNLTCNNYRATLIPYCSVSEIWTPLCFYLTATLTASHTEHTCFRAFALAIPSVRKALSSDNSCGCLLTSFCSGMSISATPMEARFPFHSLAPSMALFFSYSYHHLMHNYFMYELSVSFTKCMLCIRGLFCSLLHPSVHEIQKVLS